MPPPQRYIQPTNIVESSEPEGSDGFSSIPVSSYNFGFTEVTPTEPTSEPAPTQEESQAVPESPPKQSTSDTGGPSADIEEPPRPQQKRLNLGAVGRQSAQDKHSTVQSQETGPATSGQRGRTARVKGKPSNKQSMTRGGKYASNRKFKEPKPSKMKTPMPNAPAKNPTVIPVPESIGSQIVTLLEVVAGAALMFFGATQVGNILINNIVQGMLGG